MASPDRNSGPRIDADDEPQMSQTNWDDIGANAALIGELDAVTDEPTGELAEEDDDNLYQESDDILPDTTEERVLLEDPSREGTRFGEEPR